ncbi:MAG: transcriptional regulator [Bacteroidetes bacterium GWA2_31_9]|nr:MAG: transcriptional regulator [Bacteroidetes bacterium GWA2_31_9]
MKVSLIKTEKEYLEALDLVDEMFDKKVKKDTSGGNDLELLLLVIKDYEDKHYTISFPDPIEAIKCTMKEKGLKNKDLEKYIGSKSYVSQILNKKKPLTVAILKILHKNLNIPSDILLA